MLALVAGVRVRAVASGLSCDAHVVDVARAAGDLEHGLWAQGRAAGDAGEDKEALAGGALVDGEEVRWGVRAESGGELLEWRM